MNYKSIADKLRRGIEAPAHTRKDTHYPARSRSKECQPRNVSLNDASTRKFEESLQKRKSPLKAQHNNLNRRRAKDMHPVPFESFFKYWGSPKHKIKAPTPLQRPQRNFFSTKKAPDRSSSKDRVASEQRKNAMLKKDRLNQTLRRKDQSRPRKKQVPPLIMREDDTPPLVPSSMATAEQQTENIYGLADDDFKKFGNRFPSGFKKRKLLGQGGFACVWLGQHRKSGRPFAVKQILTANQHQTHKKQIWFGTYFFRFKGQPKSEFASHEGIAHIARLFSYQMNYVDTWLIYQKCGDSLGKCLYELEQQQLMGMQMFRLVPKPLYKRMRTELGLLKQIIAGIAKALMLLSENGIVHSDLKSENVLVRVKGNDISEVKVIDFGSCFLFQKDTLDEFSMATPEYMSPELLSFIQKENRKPYSQDILDRVRHYTHPWVIDVWSLGCIILQILHGVPIWLNCQTIIQRPHDSKPVTTRGAFAVDGRKFDKIIKKQLSVISHLDQFLERQCLSGITTDESLRRVLKGCLQLQPQRRLSPARIVGLLEGR